jgi:phosphatidylserine/phosphatidylglycerophosphate/cardiolipin synthase-like enzyme
MPFRQTPKTHTPYAIIAFDKSGNERTDDPDGIKGLISDRLLSEVQQTGPSDIFVFSHGWQGDMVGAISQYDSWIDCKAALTADAAKMGTTFKPVYVGLHWPSEPWGDEELKGGGTSFDIGTVPASDALEAYLDRLDLKSSLHARELLGEIFRENQSNAGAVTLPPQVVADYRELAGMIGYKSGQRGDDPASDNAPFDPQAAFAAMNAAGSSFALGGLGGLLSPLRVLSFWTMKKRARSIGESGMFHFVAQLQQSAPHSRIHLIGHSFGCIVVSSICGGLKDATSLPRPVDSLTLLQGALSLWAYAEAVPSTGGKGYYQPFLNRRAVRGPIVTTRSTHDFACNIFYPAAVGLLVQDPSFGINPTRIVVWGAVGAFGIQGRPDAIDTPMQPETVDYHFELGKIYNLEASKFIAKLQGASGAHSDINEPAVMHALWQAAYTSLATSVAQPAERVMVASAGTGTSTGSAPQPAPPPTFASVPPRVAGPTTPLGDKEMPIPFGLHVDGKYLPPILPNALEFIQGDSTRAIARKALATSATFGLADGFSPDDLKQSGWGVVFSAKTAPQEKAGILEALDPLLQLRKQQAGGAYETGGRFKIFHNEIGYQDGASAEDWLQARGVGPFMVNPSKGVPYYLLLIGSPDEIPFDFQYELDCFFAVGRLHFDTPQDYAKYAANIVSFERSSQPQQKTIALFNTRNPGDRATNLLHDQVAVPLMQGGDGLPPLGKDDGYTIVPFLAKDASKDNLGKILRGATPAGTPALLFTGSHGMAFDPAQPDLLESNQGALVTADWQGPDTPVTEEMYFTAADVPTDSSLSGTIYFCFACYGAACPQFDTYNYLGDQPLQIAPRTIFARLPRQLLLAGAQAVIGHVDRSWAYSFQNQQQQAMVDGFRDPLRRILHGRRIGEALDIFDQRWAAMSTELLRLINNRNAIGNVPDPLLANRWVARDDARNYIILGDPAVRLKTASTTANSGGPAQAQAASFGVSSSPAPAPTPASFPAHLDAKPHLDFSHFTGVFNMKAAVSPDSSYQLISQALQQASDGTKVDLYIYSITAPFLMQLLKDAHDRGAAIRVMYDPAQMKKEAADQLRGFGLTVRVAPSHDPRRVFTVCHEKFAVIDGKTVLLESANWDPNSIPERESGQPRKKGNREWLVRIDDKRVAEWYSSLFQADWDIPQQVSFGVDLIQPVQPLSFRAPSQTGRDFPITTFTGVPMDLLPLTSPDNYFDSILPLLQGAQRRIWLQQQYIQGGGGPGVPQLLEAVANRKAAGVDVRIVISSRFPQAWQQSKTTIKDAGLLADLRAINLDFFTLCHNKGVIVDDSVVVSSTNWSENSLRRAREAGILIHSDAVTGFFSSVFEDDWNTGWTVSTADSQAPSFSVPLSPGQDTVEIDPADQM